MREDELRHLTAVFNISTTTADISVPALLFPPIEGRFRVVFQEGLSRDVRKYITLHELGHVLAGEADEPMRMIFEGPLPDNEDVADLFALLGIVPTVDIEEGGSWLDERIRQLVPLDDRGWQMHRIPRLSKRLPRVREMVADLPGYF